jgi:hypothetical protein
MSRIHPALQAALVQSALSRRTRREPSPQTSQRARVSVFDEQVRLVQCLTAPTSATVRSAQEGQRARSGDAGQASFQQPRVAPLTGLLHCEHVVHTRKRTPPGQ